MQFTFVILIRPCHRVIIDRLMLLVAESVQRLGMDDVLCRLRQVAEQLRASAAGRLHRHSGEVSRYLALHNASCLTSSLCGAMTNSADKNS